MATQPTNKNSDLLKYAGLATQFLVSIGLSVFFGFKLDSWLRIGFPVFVWVIPLVVIIAMIYKLAKETGNNK